ncbi:hypothetical protein ARD30_01295 [Bosea thiooxidans]|uniref:Uncharacterized protein n=1 Tax=Bosea thiooxidans TaxID=53254 RepID=A0A0Q3KRK5_9HYPH|nr:hypothetical protein ARD30_01295 [Bosea thiooxidans]
MAQFSVFMPVNLTCLARARNRARHSGAAAGPIPDPMNGTFAVMVGLVPTIHVFARRSPAVFKMWMLATRASMTKGGDDHSL